MKPRLQYVKTQDRLDTIPPQLCLVQEACAILGVKNRSALTTYIKKGLRYTYAIYKGTRKLIFNRQEVASYRHPKPPANTISTSDLAALIHKTCNIKLSNTIIIHHLKHHHSIHPQLINAHHPYLVWPKDTAIPAAIAAAKNYKPRKSSKA